MENIQEVQQLEIKSNDEIAQQETTADHKLSSTIQKMKNDMRIIIDKLNEVCGVNSSMLSKIKELVDENNDLNDRVEKQKIELTELNQYGFL